MLSYQTLFSGSRGNALFVASETTKILVDAGLSALQIEMALQAVGEDAASLDAILITHEHHDHAAGAGTLCRRYGVPLYAAPKVWETFDGFGNIPACNAAEYTYDMVVGDLSFDFFKTYHDTVQPIGLVIRQGSLRLGICTDTGIVTPRMIELMKNADGLVFEANHDYNMLRRGTYPAALKARVSGREGHLSNEEAAYALAKIIGKATRYVLLAHLSEANNNPGLAFSTVSDILAREGVGRGVTIQVAPPYSPSPRYTLSEQKEFP